MRLFVEPPLNRWQLEPVTDDDRDRRAARKGLFDCLVANAQRLGCGQPSVCDTTIATGHQAWLWHPGILAKDLAMSVAAQRRQVGMFHVVVDQDVHPPLRLELPVMRHGRLSVEVVELGPGHADVPTGFQPPVESGLIQRRLTEVTHRLGDALVANLDPIIEAFANPPDCHTLAQQITVAIQRWRTTLAGGPIPVVFASELVELPVYQRLLGQILSDARGCVASYNRAVQAQPDAGVAALRVEPDRVELPLWALAWCQRRQRVFADLAGDRPMFTLANGQGIDYQRPGEGRPDTSLYTLAPKALLMTAVLRRWCCQLFVHGRGGGVYDRITEGWWRYWLGQTLAPIAVVSADLSMDFAGVPIADEQTVQRAVWRLHHLPHNIDRARTVSQVDGGPVNRKRWLIDHMNDDRDRQRRASSFAQIHRINHQLAQAHRGILVQAQQELDQARLGLANRAVAAKRDWCFALYEPGNLRALEQALTAHAVS